MTEKESKGEPNAALNEKFLLHSSYTAKAKEEFDEQYRQLVDKLSPTHLEPFAKILLEQDKCEFDCERAMESIKKEMLSSLLAAWDNVWQDSASVGITKLQMLKDYFKEYEGKDWNVVNKNPVERILPLQVRFKQGSLKWLKKQVEIQNKLLEEKCLETVERRKFLEKTESDWAGLTMIVGNHAKNREQIVALKKKLHEFLEHDLEK